VTVTVTRVAVDDALGCQVVAETVRFTKTR